MTMKKIKVFRLKFFKNYFKNRLSDCIFKEQMAKYMSIIFALLRISLGEVTAVRLLVVKTQAGLKSNKLGFELG